MLSLKPNTIAYHILLHGIHENLIVLLLHNVLDVVRKTTTNANSKLKAITKNNSETLENLTSQVLLDSTTLIGSASEVDINVDLYMLAYRRPAENGMF